MSASDIILLALAAAAAVCWGGVWIVVGIAVLIILMFPVILWFGLLGVVAVACLWLFQHVVGLS